MKKLMLMSIVFAIACSCKKPSNDPVPQPQKKAVAVVLSMIVDNNKPLGQRVDVIYTRDARVDTFNLSNYPGMYYYIAIYDYDNVTFSSTQNMDITVKVDDGSIFTKNIYAEYKDIKLVNFKVSELK